jgi:hypothetical protein
MSLNVSRGCGVILLALTLAPSVAWAEPPESAVALPREPTAATRASLPPSAAHPFAQMAGTWSGGGSIELTGDIKENLRCRANYTHGASNNSLALNIRCASDNYKFELASNVVERGGRLTGTWSEAAYKVSGNITGRVVGNNISALAQGDSFSADLAVTTTANRMMVTMTPKATYVISVKMAFSRAGAAAR